MQSQEYLEEMKIVQDSLLTYIENEDNIETNYQNLITLFTTYKFIENWHEVKSLLYLFLKILDNHHRSATFFSKFSQIFKYFKKEINRIFSNLEIFDIFKDNKRAILLLIEEQILTIDQTITNIIFSPKYQAAKYPLYFFPEIKPFINEEQIQEYSQQLPENFDEKRHLGENDNRLCEIIRNGSVDDFTSYVNENQIALSSKVESSIFETNMYLLENQPTLIEYAAFFGATSIVNYMHTNYIDLNPPIWPFAVHSQNMALIHLLQDNNIAQINNSFETTLKESVKCHHNDITNYILAALPPTETEISMKAFSESFEFHNFAYMEDAYIDESTFYYLCLYGYYELANILLKQRNVDVNARVISKSIFFDLSSLNSSYFEYNFKLLWF